MCSWLSSTVRLDGRYAFSRIAQYAAEPCHGAYVALLHLLDYYSTTAHLCLRQSLTEPGEWSFFSDSDLCGNAEEACMRRGSASETQPASARRALGRPAWPAARPAALPSGTCHSGCLVLSAALERRFRPRLLSDFRSPRCAPCGAICAEPRGRAASIGSAGVARGESGSPTQRHLGAWCYLQHWNGDSGRGY